MKADVSMCSVLSEFPDFFKTIVPTCYLCTFWMKYLELHETDLTLKKL
jgi:hypothetical protein